MKIRTDFVTNSSSSSFVCYVVGAQPFVDFLVNKAMPKLRLTSEDVLCLEAENESSHRESLAQMFCRNYFKNALENPNGSSELDEMICSMEDAGSDVSYLDYEFTHTYDGTPESAARVLEELFEKTDFLEHIDVHYESSEVGGGEVDEPRKTVYCNGVCFQDTAYRYGRGYTFSESEELIEDYHIQVAVSGIDSYDIRCIEEIGAEVCELSSDTKLLIVGNSPDQADVELAKSLGVRIFDYANIKKAMYRRSYWDETNNAAYDRITEVDLKGVKYLRNSAFKGFPNLQKVTLYPGVTSISRNAFVKCESLSEITIPEGVTTIGKNAFERCVSLKTITLPESLDTIESEAFLDCWNLEEIIIKGKLMYIGKDAFKRCKALKEEPVLDPSAEVVEYSDELSGKTFVITGTLPSLEREEAIALIEQHGGRVTGSVSSKTSFLIIGEDAGSKLQKAKSLNIPILTEEEFRAMLNPAVRVAEEETSEIEHVFREVQRDCGKLSEYESLLWNAFLKAETQEEMLRFLLDLCSVPDLIEFSKRVEIAMHRLDGMTTADITRTTGGSSSTIAKINKILEKTGTNGFSYLYKKMKQQKYDFGSWHRKDLTQDDAAIVKVRTRHASWLPSLADALLYVKTEEAVKSLVYDICSDSELKSMLQRIKAAEMILKNHMPAEISKATGISSGIIRKVDYAIHYCGTGGFGLILGRID